MLILNAIILGLFLCVAKSASTNFNAHPMLLVRQQLAAIHENARLRNTMSLKELLDITSFYRDLKMIVKYTRSVQNDEDELNYAIYISLSPCVVTEAYYTTEGIEAEVETFSSGLQLTEQIFMTKNDRSFTGWIAKFPQRTNNFNYIAPDNYKKKFHWLNRIILALSQPSSENPTECSKFFETIDNLICEEDEWMEETILN